jgi:hypothetical protein
VALNDQVANAGREIVQSQKATYVDMADYICAGPVCEAERDGAVTYQAGGHLSVGFVK